MRRGAARADGSGRAVAPAPPTSGVALVRDGDHVVPALEGGVPLDHDLAAGLDGGEALRGGARVFDPALDQPGDFVGGERGLRVCAALRDALPERGVDGARADRLAVEHAPARLRLFTQLRGEVQRELQLGTLGGAVADLAVPGAAARERADLDDVARAAAALAQERQGRLRREEGAHDGHVERLPELLLRELVDAQ